jgi:hypothetical protein
VTWKWSCEDQFVPSHAILRTVSELWIEAAQQPQGQTRCWNLERGF